jgi:hypothetical protein
VLVSTVQFVDGVESDCRFGGIDPTLGFETTDDVHLVATTQPIRRWHRRAVMEERAVAEDNRFARSIADRDGIGAAGLAAEETHHCLFVGGAGSLARKLHG